MHLENISLTNFKNYRECSINFSPHINCITGPNAAGKTNLLDAIYYLSLTKSAFNPVDKQNIFHENQFFSIRGNFRKDGKSVPVQCSLKNGEKKIIKCDHKAYPKLSGHIGRFPAVIITPYDTDIIREGSSYRRKFINNILSQTNPQYLEDLITYQQTLKQRNQLLKSVASYQKPDPDLLSVYDHSLLELGASIYATRRSFIEEFQEIFIQNYQQISGADETVGITYRSDLEAPHFNELFRASIDRDMASQRTTLGIHRDDLICHIDSRPARKFGSQGQQKSFVIALKIAQFEIIRRLLQVKPLLLLDDIFDKLDDQRIENLMTMVAGNVFGQIFITDARPERSDKILEGVASEKLMLMIEGGTVKEE